MEKLYCTKCGKENSLDGARFCAFCGGELTLSSLPAAQQKITNGMHDIRPRSRMGTDRDRGGEVPSKNVWPHHVLQD